MRKAASAARACAPALRSVPLHISFLALLSAIAAMMLLSPSPVAAADALEIPVVIKDHRFDPAEIRVPAQKSVKLMVKNMDASSEEFESKVLRIEKVIAPNSTGTVRLKPLEPGRYPFVGEFHEDTAKGTIVVE